MEIHICQNCGHLVHKRTSVCESCGVPSEGNIITMDAGAAEKMNRTFSGDPQQAVKTMKVIFEREMPASDEVNYSNAPAVSQFRTGIWSSVGDQTQSSSFTGLLSGVEKQAPKSAVEQAKAPSHENEQEARLARERERRQDELERQQREQAEFEEQQQEYERRRKERAELARQQHYQNRQSDRNVPGTPAYEEAQVQARKEAVEKAEFERKQKEYEQKLAEYQRQQAEYELQQAEYEKKQAEYERQQAQQADYERKLAEQAEYERQQAEREAAQRAEIERQQTEREEAERAEIERHHAEREAAARAEIERQQTEREEAERAEIERHHAERQAAARAEIERQQATQAEYEKMVAAHAQYSQGDEQEATIDVPLDLARAEHNAELENLSEEERAEYLAQLKEFELQRAEYERIRMEAEGFNPEAEVELEESNESFEPHLTSVVEEEEQTVSAPIDTPPQNPELSGEALITKFMDQLFDSSNMESGPQYSVEFDPAASNSLEEMHANLHSSGSQGMLAEQIASSSEASDQTTSGNYRAQNGRREAFGAVTMESVKDTNFENSVANQFAQNSTNTNVSGSPPFAVPQNRTESSSDPAAKTTFNTGSANQESQRNSSSDNYYRSPDLDKFEASGFSDLRSEAPRQSGSYKSTSSNVQEQNSSDQSATDEDPYQTDSQLRMRRDNRDSQVNSQYSNDAQASSGKFERQNESGRYKEIDESTSRAKGKAKGGIFDMEVEAPRENVTASAEQHLSNGESTSTQTKENTTNNASRSRIFPYDNSPDKSETKDSSNNASEPLKSPLLSKQLDKASKPKSAGFKKIVLPLLIAAGAFVFLAGVMLIRVPSTSHSSEKTATKSTDETNKAPSPNEINSSEPNPSQANIASQAPASSPTGPAAVAPLDPTPGEAPNLLDAASGPPETGSGLTMVQKSHSTNPMQQLPAQPMQQMPAQTMPQMPAQTMPQMPAQTMPQMPAQTMPQMPAQTMPQMPAQTMPQIPAQTMPQAPPHLRTAQGAVPPQQIAAAQVKARAPMMRVDTTSMTGKWDYGYQNPSGSTGYGAIQIKQDGINLRGSGTDSSGTFQIKGVRQGDIITFDKLYVRNGAAISKRIVYSGKLSIYDEPGVGPAMLMSGIWRYSGQDNAGKEKVFNGQFEGKLAR